MSPTNPLAEAIDHLYAAFADVPRPAAIAWCEHCVDETDIASLLEPVPLRTLSAATLRPYTSNVPYTVGSRADLRYFLPRMLEIACTDDGWPDLEGMCFKLSFADWSDWADDEQSAVRGLLHAYWTTRLTTRSEAPDLGGVLDDIAHAERDLTPYLDEWTHAMHEPAAAAGLLELLRSSTRPMSHDFHRWDSVLDDQDDQFVRWILSGELRAALAEAVDAADTADALQTLIDIGELLALRAPNAS